MKRLIHSHEDVFGMSNVRPKYALPCVRELIPEFIYVSSREAGHGPRVKFSGGTCETNKKDTCPSMEFDNNGNCEVVLQPFMNKDNCPNAYDKKIKSNVKLFVKRMLPILLVMWYERVDEATCYNYIQGFVPLQGVVDELNCNEPIHNLSELDAYCRKNNLYSFDKKGAA